LNINDHIHGPRPAGYSSGKPGYIWSWMKDTSWLPIAGGRSPEQGHPYPRDAVRRRKPFSCQQFLDFSGIYEILNILAIMLVT
jgi:hypothetical protein